MAYGHSSSGHASLDGVEFRLSDVFTVKPKPTHGHKFGMKDVDVLLEDLEVRIVKRCRYFLLSVVVFDQTNKSVCGILSSSVNVFWYCCLAMNCRTTIMFENGSQDACLIKLEFFYFMNGKFI